MGLLQKLKSILGVAEEEPSPRGDVDVTVEREPSEVSAGSERAVTEPADASTTGVPDVSAPSDDAAAEPGTVTEESTGAAGDGEPEPAAAGEAAAEPVESIKGVGPSYASRLGDAGVDTVGDLAGADAAALAESTDLSEKRIARWIEQAEARTR